MTPADGPATAAPRPATARTLENVLFSAALVAPRLPWADLPARALGLGALTREGLTRLLITRLRGGRDGRAGLPVRLSTPYGTFLVPLTRRDAEDLLSRADAAGALGPACGLAADGRRRGLSPHEEPPGVWDVLTEDERDGLAGRVAGHLTAVLGARREDGTLDAEHWHDAMLRLSRQVVLGADATRDTLLSAMVTAAADAEGSRAYEARAAAVERRMAPYLADPEPGSLAARPAARGRGDGRPHLALAHALALVSAATTGSALQALALLAADAAPPEGAMDLALELYPPLSAVVYPVRAPLGGDGPAVAAGSEILYVPTLLGPGTEAAAQAERTDPAWALCGSPSGCAAARFAAVVGREVVRGIAAGARPVLLAPRLDGDRLPDALDPRSLVVALGAADGRDGPQPTAGQGVAALSAYGALGQAGADRLERHAESLAACAADAGWNGSGTGERFRMALLAHADRCARAAADVRRAGRWLSD